MDVNRKTKKNMDHAVRGSFLGHLLLIVISGPIHRQIFCWQYCFGLMMWINSLTFPGVPEEHPAPRPEPACDPLYRVT